MDINFHYFAVKTLAVKAGFSNNQAQIIAEFSQYVDDFNRLLKLTCNNIPNYMTTDNTFVSKFIVGNKLKPVTTGFSDIIDNVNIALADGCKYIVSPFHFIPNQVPAGLAANTEVQNEYVNVATMPATMTNPSIITNLLTTVKTNYMQPNISNNQKDLYLVQLGLYLHIFADTYAHQGFSGYESNINNKKITQYTRTGDSGKDIIKTNIYRALPSVGHANVGHFPDLTNYAFVMKDSQGKQEARDNTVIFLQVAQEIFGFLKSFFPNTTNPQIWDKTLEADFVKAFDKEYNPHDFSSMQEAWAHFNIQYHYNVNNIFNNNGNIYDEKFYWFNYSAYQVLKALQLIV